MRQIGSLPDPGQAQTFIDYLLVRGVKGTTERESDGWSIWVFDEDKVELAKTELEAFRRNPSDPQVVEAAAQAAAVRSQEIQKARRAKKQVVDVGERWRRPASAALPMTMLMAVLCFCVSVLGDFGRRPELATYDELSFTSHATLLRTRIEGPTAGWVFRDVMKGEVWRLLTPIFLHFSYSHLLFNTYSLIVLGGITEIRLGPWKALGLMLLFGLVGNVAQAVMRGPHFGGFSGVVFGLFGYVWMRSRYDPASGFYISPTNVVLTMLFFAVCVAGGAGPIANWAHGGGLVSGVVCGYVASMRHGRRT